MVATQRSDAEYWHRKQPVGGGTPAYATAEEVWAAAVEAFDWLVAHPLKEEVLFHHQGHVTRTTAKKMRAFTWAGVAMLMGMSENGLKRYRDVPAFAEVMEWIESVIRTQKFEGAAANMLNASIITRDLGLADKREVSGPDGGPVSLEQFYAELSPKDDGADA